MAIISLTFFSPFKLINTYAYFRECKNRFIFAYLKSLIDCGVFKHIYLSFLPVGHTHCDADQMYSRFSVYLAGQFKEPVGVDILELSTFLSVISISYVSFTSAHPAYNFTEMAEALKKACKNIQIVEELVKFTNFKDAVSSQLNVASDTPGFRVTLIFMLKYIYI